MTIGQRHKPTMLWCNVAVTPHFSWPNMPIAVPFDGRTAVLSPPTDTLACRAALLDPNRMTCEEGGTVLSRFLSRLAWAKNGGVEEFFHIGTNLPNEPGRLGQGTYARSGWATIDPPHYIYLPSTLGEKAELGLALYREGLSVNSVPFGFLSLFKILNIRHASGAAQKKWINDNLATICYLPAAAMLNEIQALHQNVGHYMYVHGRCAAAHASSTPLVNPDIYADRCRLESDFPLIKELAALFIENELDVPSESTFHKNFDPDLHRNNILMRGGTNNGWVAYAPYNPSINFKFCTAAPDAPLPRLSSRATNTAWR